MKRSDRLALLIGVLVVISAFALMALVLYPATKDAFTVGRETHVRLSDGRTVTCISIGAQTSCDWDHAR